MKPDDDAPTGPMAAWGRFWFTPADPIGLHAVRIAAGLLFLMWLLPLAGHRDALFGLDGWFGRQAFAGAAALPDGSPKPLGWSILYLGDGGPAVVAAVYFGTLAVLVLFTLGIWVRLTAVLTWVAVASLTAHPVAETDADVLLPILAMYLMVGYVLLGQRAGGTGAARFLGGRSSRLLGPFRQPAEPSVGAAVALRLLQVHLAIVMVTTGLHKLQFGDWWAGVALWYPLHPPLETQLADVQGRGGDPERYLMVLNVVGYAVLAWQIGFPLFAWRRAGRWLLLGGAAVGWLGTAFILGRPLFGLAVFVGCLAFVSPEAWRRLIARVADKWSAWTGRANGPGPVRRPVPAGRAA